MILFLLTKNVNKYSRCQITLDNTDKTTNFTFGREFNKIRNKSFLIVLIYMFLFTGLITELLNIYIAICMLNLGPRIDFFCQIPLLHTPGSTCNLFQEQRQLHCKYIPEHQLTCD